MNAISLILAALMLAPAVNLAVRRSSYLVDYFLWVVILNRLVRRVVDWTAGQFDPTPLLSAVPLAIGAVMLMAVASQFKRLPPDLRRAAGMVAAGLAVGAVIGVPFGFGMLFALMSYASPLAVLFYAAALRVGPAVADRWLRGLVTAGVVVAVYGIVQWAIVPPWDAQWLVWSRMTTMGVAEPFQLSIWSTLESRGPASFVLAMAALPMIVEPRFRSFWRWPGLVVIIAAMLLTMARSSWGMLVCAAVAYAVLRGGRSFLQLAIATAVVGLVYVFAAPLLPESDRLADRMASLGDITSDGSFLGRVDIAQYGVGAVLGRPQGYGLGSSGLAGRVSDGADGSGLGDNGWLQLLGDLGIPGTAFFFGRTRHHRPACVGAACRAAGSGAGRIRHRLGRPDRWHTDDDHRELARWRSRVVGLDDHRGGGGMARKFATSDGRPSASRHADGLSASGR